MDEFFRIFKHFLARDLIFLIGGGTVVTSFLYYFDRLPVDSTPVSFILLGTGIAYIVGYALQDGFSLLPFVRTAPLHRLNWYVRWFYRRFTREQWQDIGVEVNFERVTETIVEERQRAELERIITLKQMGTTGGPCGLVASLFIGLKWLESCARFDLVLLFAALIFGFLLIHLGWIKLAQQAQYLSQHAR